MSAGRAEAVAQLLLARGGPAATMGHLLHMPSHTYVRVGRYHDATVANIRCAKLFSQTLSNPNQVGVCPATYTRVGRYDDATVANIQ